MQDETRDYAATPQTPIESASRVLETGVTPDAALAAEDDTVEDLSASPEERADPTAGSVATGTGVRLVFDPARSRKVKRCRTIVHVQIVQIVADGEVVDPGPFFGGSGS